MINLCCFFSDPPSPGPSETQRPSKYSRLALSSYRPIGRVPIMYVFYTSLMNLTIYAKQNNPPLMFRSCSLYEMTIFIIFTWGGNESGNRCESDRSSWDASWIPARSHTVVVIDHEIISTVILLNHSRRVVVSYKPKCVHEVLVNCLFKHAQEKSVVRWTDHPAMTLAVDLGHKATKKKKKTWGGKLSDIWAEIKFYGDKWVER